MYASLSAESVNKTLNLFKNLWSKFGMCFVVVCVH